MRIENGVLIDFPGDTKHCRVPEGTTVIGAWAFIDCKSLESVYIPRSVTKIENSAFFECGNLRRIYYAGSEEDWDKIKIEPGNLNLTIRAGRGRICHGEWRNPDG